MHQRPLLIDNFPCAKTYKTALLKCQLVPFIRVNGGNIPPDIAFDDFQGIGCVGTLWEWFVFEFMLVASLQCYLYLYLTE
jgi:hypothetical protein